MSLPALTRVKRLIMEMLIASLSVGCASSWVHTTPRETEGSMYYVGRSYNAHSPSEGIGLARNDAKLRAIEENFGASYVFQHHMVENIDSVQMANLLRANSRSINLEGFEEVEIYQEEVDDEEFNTAILYRYSKSAIKQEKLRLVSQQPVKEDFASAAQGMPQTREPMRLNRKPASSEHHVLNKTFVIGLGGVGSSTSFLQTDISAPGYAAFVEAHMSQHVALQLYGSYSSKSSEYSNGTLSMAVSSFGLGCPLYFSSADKSAWNTFITPSLHGNWSDFSFVEKSPRNSNSQVSKWQMGVAGTLGLQFRITGGESSGVTIRTQAGLYRPFITPNNQGTTAIQGGLFLAWEIFK